MKKIELEDDGLPMFSIAHPKSDKTLWGFKTPFTWLNSVLDWVYLFFNRPKLSEDNLEIYETRS